jgi:Tfp pilus assembly protein PilO
VAILITLLAIAYIGVVAPLLDFYSERQAILSKNRLIEPRLRAAAAEVPQLRARLAELRQAANATKLTFEGASDALAAAGLQSRIEELAAAAGITIASIEGVPAEASGRYRRIGLRAAVSGTYESIVRLLGAIDTTSPPLVLDNLQIHGMVVRGSPIAGRLDAGFVVYGFRGNETPTVTTP